jgi:hypothetical protein
LRVTKVNQKQKARWVKLRVKGESHFIFRVVAVSALCAVAGQIVWWLLMLIWRGDSTPHFVREPGSALAMIVGFAVAGYLQSGREWKKSEREYVAQVESEGNNHAVV